jgi:type VI secretion system protein ImpF
MSLPSSTPADKWLPCLLDRLIDNSPANKEEPRSARVISMSDYIAAVRRDLSWLLNCNTHRESDGYGEFPDVESSVLNFGKPDLSGLGIASLIPEELEEALFRAIRLYEPRIIVETLSVRAVRTSENDGPTVLAFEIRGELWARPYPEKLFIKTALDLETGAVVVT